MELTEDEKNQLFDLAALAKDNTVSPDLPEYIMEHELVRVALRRARDVDAGKEEWEKVIKIFNDADEKKKK